MFDTAQDLQNFLMNFFGLVLSPAILFYVFWETRMDFVQTRFINSIDWVTFMLKIPKEVKKTSRAMEQIFAGFHGIYDPPNWIERNIKGIVQLWMGLEFVSRSGDIYFYIHTPAKFRNLIESQIYGQYPAVEIEKVDDYVNDIPSDIPNQDYNFLGTEMMLAKPDAYPIRTYSQFESLFETKEETWVDPLASIIELLSRIKEGEQIWLQYLIKPCGSEWKEEGDKFKNKLLGRKAPAKKSFFILFISEIIGAILGGGPSTPQKVERPVSLVAMLTPGEREVIEAIEKNIAKLGFFTKIRVLYLAPNSAFDASNFFAILGAFKHFNTLNLNGFKVNKKTLTKIKYLFKKTRELYRKRKILAEYKRRHFKDRKFIFLKTKSFVLNTEEMATIYHYPGLAVPAITMPRVEARRGGPPMSLPVE